MSSYNVPRSLESTIRTLRELWRGKGTIWAIDESKNVVGGTYG